MDSTVIDHPGYYMRNGLEAIDIIEEYRLNFSEGCIVKYLWRMGLKDGEVLEKDQRKALWYFDRESDRLFRMERGTFTSCGVAGTDDGDRAMAREILFQKLERIFMRPDLNMVEAVELLRRNLVRAAA
jgi:hypothetical protein